MPLDLSLKCLGESKASILLHVTNTSNPAQGVYLLPQLNHFYHVWFTDTLLCAISLVQLLSHVWLFVTPWIAAHQASLSITNSRSLPKLVSIELVMPSSHLILCGPLLLLPPIPSSIRVFSNESALRMRWPKYWNFSLSISPSNEHLGLVSFGKDWLDLLAVRGTHKSLLQHHSSKASIDNMTIYCHRSKEGAQPSSQSNSHIHTWPPKKP